VTSDSRILTSRILERAETVGLSLPVELAVRLGTFYELLFRWNRTINLTALTDSPAAIDRLLLEPVAAAPYLPGGSRLLDLGSGGGSPALPLAVLLGSTHLVMVESRGRKAAFLREALRELVVPGEVVEGRLESVAPASRAPFAVVSARAIQLNAEHLEKIASLLQPDGVLAFFRGPSSPDLPQESGFLRSASSHPLPVSAGTTLELFRCSTWNNRLD
jgi:16S rRNA (guanine527-N7)-methyltransferase